MSVFPWQQAAWHHLSEQITSGTLSHALLFSGPAGNGLESFAQSLAHRLLCDNASGHDPACGQCKQCRLIDADTHADIVSVTPEEKSSVIKVDAIRRLVEFFNASSQQGGRKVALIYPAEALNVNAANALLKTLEEPTPDSVLILVSGNPGRLLPTSRSRCQVLEFAIPDINTTRDWLMLDDAISSGSESALDAVISMAAGAPLLAKEYMLNDAGAEVEKMQQELAAVLKQELGSSAVADRWSDDLALKRVHWMIQWLEQIIRYKASNNERYLQYSPMQKMFVYLADKASPAELYALYDESRQQAGLLAGPSNPNPALLFESLLFGWMSLMRRRAKAGD